MKVKPILIDLRHYNKYLLYYNVLDENSGPAYDLQMFRRLLTAHQVPQLLPFLCLDAPEVCVKYGLFNLPQWFCSPAFSFVV